MGKKEQTLGRLLSAVGFTTKNTLSRPTEKDLSAPGVFDKVMEVYLVLGGVEKVFPSNLRKPWDIEFEGVAVALDEQLHFNRYRLKTLASPLYRELSGFPLSEYEIFCERFEPDCTRSGSYGRK